MTYGPGSGETYPRPADPPEWRTPDGDRIVHPLDEGTWPPDDDDEHRGHHRELWGETAARAEQDALDPPDGAEPDRAAEYERTRRAILTDQEREELVQQKAGIIRQMRSMALDASGDLARALLAMNRAGFEVPTEVLRAHRSVQEWLDALEGAGQGEWTPAEEFMPLVPREEVTPNDT
jgi:hypothetical protein